MNKKYRYFVFPFVFHSFVLTFHFFAHCIRAMYMYILSTKVKSLAIECIISIIYNLIYVSYIFHHSGSNQDIEVRITDPHIRRLQINFTNESLRNINLEYTLCLSLEQ